MARCPKCHCGELVEIGRRMVCLNCDYSCSRAHARLLQNSSHIHTQVSYTNQIRPRQGTAGSFSRPNVRNAPAGNAQPARDAGAGKGKSGARIGAAAFFFFILILAMILFQLAESCSGPGAFLR